VPWPLQLSKLDIGFDPKLCIYCAYARSWHLHSSCLWNVLRRLLRI